MSEERKKRINITSEILRMARDFIEKNKSTSDMSDLLGISISAARALSLKITQGLSDSQILIKKGRKKKDKTAIKGLIATTLINENSLTQSSIKSQIAEHGFERSQTFISKILHEMEFTRKRLVLIPIERNSPRILETRQLYARSINSISIEKLVYLDETGFNMHLASHFGYSPKNEKAFVTVPANKGKNISLMAAISVSGIVSYEFKDGSYSGEDFKQYILTNLIPYFSEHLDSILIMDNCRFHHRLDVLSLLSERRIAFKFLPAYSPHLNPIEEYFGELKANYRSMLPRVTSRQEIKSRVESLIINRAGGFIPGFEKAKRLLDNALAREPFI